MSTKYNQSEYDLFFQGTEIERTLEVNLFLFWRKKNPKYIYRLTFFNNIAFYPIV
jgi:hypothetical protein